MCAQKILLNENNIRDKVLTHYGIEVGEIEKIAKGQASSSFKLSCANNNDKFYFLKEPLTKVPLKSIKAEARLMRFLKKCGIPVTDFVRTLDGAWHFDYDGKYITLQNFIFGDEYGRKNVSKELQMPSFAMLGKIDASLANYKMRSRKSVSVAYCESYSVSDIVDSLSKSLNRLDGIDICQEELSKISKAVKYSQEIQASVKEYAPLFKYVTYSPTHGDYHVDNLIYGGDEIVAIVDWTSAGSMPVVLNLMLLGLDFGIKDHRMKSIDLTPLIDGLKEYTAHASLSYYDYKLMPYIYLHVWGRNAIRLRVKRYVAHKIAGNDEIAERKLKTVLRAVSIYKHLRSNVDTMSRQLEKYYESTLSKEELKKHRKWLKEQDHMKWLYKQERIARLKRILRKVTIKPVKRIAKRILQRESF